MKNIDIINALNKYESIEIFNFTNINLKTIEFIKNTKTLNVEYNKIVCLLKFLESKGVDLSQL